MSSLSYPPGDYQFILRDGTRINTVDTHARVETFRWSPYPQSTTRNPAAFDALTLHRPIKRTRLSDAGAEFEVEQGWMWIIDRVYADCSWETIRLYYRGQMEAQISGPQLTSPDGFQPISPWKFNEHLPFSLERVPRGQDVSPSSIHVMLVGVLVKKRP